MDPGRFDVAGFAAAGDELAGHWPLSALGRLSESVLGSEPEGAAVHWQVQGDLRPVTGSAPQVWLRLSAQASVSMRCQRCLGALAVPLDLDRWIRFVPDAATAEALDAELEDDVLELQRQTDLRELIEDELLLTLPLVPRHEGACPQPLPMAAGEGDDAAPAARANPFAALAQLKKKPPGDDEDRED